MSVLAVRIVLTSNPQGIRIFFKNINGVFSQSLLSFGFFILFFLPVRIFSIFLSWARSFLVVERRSHPVVFWRSCPFPFPFHFPPIAGHSWGIHKKPELFRHPLPIGSSIRLVSPNSCSRSQGSNSLACLCVLFDSLPSNDLFP